MGELRVIFSLFVFCVDGGMGLLMDKSLSCVVCFFVSIVVLGWELFSSSGSVCLLFSLIAIGLHSVSKEVAPDFLRRAQISLSPGLEIVFTSYCFSSGKDSLR